MAHHLADIDLATGDQPLAARGGRVLAFQNGEIDIMNLEGPLAPNVMDGDKLLNTPAAVIGSKP